ncbi:porin family protein [Bacteroides sp. UBA939]|uniref:porin family protein n=1 Tax=Bacteroides sp. UBA939 TaxID=1946092 RepID=UPI0025BAACA6|nr:porin family protein [Bacteroides sp. UBA939]
MKRLTVLALLLSITACICHSQVKISVQGGTGLTGITKNENYKANFGYRFGVGVEFPIDQTWSIQTGLQFLNRSYSFDEGVMALGSNEEGEQTLIALYIDSKMNAIYLQVPIKVAAYLPLNDKCGLQFSAGPYIAYGVGGESYLKWLLVTQVHPDPNVDISDLNDSPNRSSVRKGEQSHKTFTKDGGLKRLDIGLGLGVDFKYKRFFAGIGAEYGFLPIDKEFPKELFRYTLQEDQTLVSPRNIGIELHVGFCFSLGK